MQKEDVAVRRRGGDEVEETRDTKFEDVAKDIQYSQYLCASIPEVLS